MEVASHLIKSSDLQDPSDAGTAASVAENPASASLHALPGTASPARTFTPRADAPVAERTEAVAGSSSAAGAEIGGIGGIGDMECGPGGGGTGGVAVPVKPDPGAVAGTVSSCIDAVGALLEQAQLYQLALARHLGLSVTDIEVLNHLLRCGPTRVGDVATALDMRSSVVSGIADRLESKGYLHRALDATDRRHRLLELTRDGVHDYNAVVENAWHAGSEHLPGHVARTAAAARWMGAQMEAARHAVSSQPPQAPAPRRMR